MSSLKQSIKPVSNAESIHPIGFINTIDFEKILTFNLARGFDLVLSLGKTTPLISPVMGIS